MGGCTMKDWVIRSRRAWTIVSIVLASLFFLGPPARAGSRFREFHLPDVDSLPQGITAGPDGNLWFAWDFIGGFYDYEKIGRITTAGAINSFTIPTGNCGPYGIAAGPDGNLWFTEETGEKIGRITTAGSITEFPIPTANSLPEGIAGGPDGNLWFTEAGGNKIGRITTTG